MNQNRPDNERTTRTIRIVTLDFNGGSHVYRNPELGMNIPVRIVPSGISDDRARMLAEALNRNCADSHVRFEVGATSSEGKSSVRIGRTADFDRYGAFLGLAEGIGKGNAFVLLDGSANDAELVDVIRHEAGHILGTLDHGGAGLARYAWEHVEDDYRYIMEEPGYSVYLSYQKTTTSVCQYITVTGESDEDIWLFNKGPGTLIERWYGAYETGKGHPETSYETVTSEGKVYIAATNATARKISVWGGTATNCFCVNMDVMQSSTYDSYVLLGGTATLRPVERYSNYTYYSGVAVNCTVTGKLYVGAYSVASNCISGSLSVAGQALTVYHELDFDSSTYNYTDDYSRSRGTAENCIVTGGTLHVEYGGSANDIVVQKGNAHLGINSSINSVYSEEIPVYDREEEASHLTNLGYAEANNLIMEDGMVTVNYGGKLHNATINGGLVATEGAVLSGVITCKGVNLRDVTPQTNITIKLDLNDYANPSYIERPGDGTEIEYYANYTMKTIRYENNQVISVTNGVFDNKDGRFDMSNWEYTFTIDNIGKVDALALPYIVLDFGGTEKDFDGGRIMFQYLYSASDPNQTEFEMPFQVVGDKRNYTAPVTIYDFYEGNGYYISVKDITYDSGLYGEATDVLWLEHGEDENAEYQIALSPVMLGATENLTVTMNGGSASVLPDSKLKGSTLIVKGEVDSGKLVVKAEEKNGVDHSCDLDLWVIPEELPIIGKAGTKILSEMLKKMKESGAKTFTKALPHNIHTNIYGMPFDLNNVALTVSADFSEKTFLAKLQGKIAWKLNKDTAGTGKQLNLVIDLSGANYITIRNKYGAYDWNIVGEFKVPDFKIGGFEFSGMSLNVNTVQSAFSAAGFVKLPWIKYAFGGDIGIVDGYLDHMAIGVGGINKQLGGTPLFVQSVKGSISGIATSTSLSFSGTFGLTGGPVVKIEFADWLGLASGEYSLCEITTTGTMTTSGDFYGTATTSVLGGFITGGRSAGIKNGELFVSGTFGVMNNCITIEGELRAGLSNGITLTGKGTMSVPREKIFGPLAGLTLNVNTQTNLNVQSPSASYVKAWSEITIFGKKMTGGFQYSFDGGLKLLGFGDNLTDTPKRSMRTLDTVSRSLPASESVAAPLRGATPPSASEQYMVTDPGQTLFQVFFSVSGGSMSLSYDGLEYTQADIAAGTYANMQVVGDLTGEDCITVAVDNALLGEWTINAFGDAQATFGAYTILSGTSAPVLTSVEVGADQRSATIRYTADFSGLTNATVSIYRAAADATDYFTSGSMIAEIAAATSTGVYEYMLPDDVDGGSYSFYLAVNSDDHAPIFSSNSGAYTFRSNDTEAPDQIQVISSEWTSSGTVVTWEAPWDDHGIAGYKVRYAAGDEDMAEVDVKTTSFTFDQGPNGMYDFHVAAYDAADNLSEWSEQQSCLVLTVANATYKNMTLTEDLELGEYESAVGIAGGEFTVTAAANSLISGSTIGDAEISGIVENAAVNGAVTLGEGALGCGLTVNGNMTLADGASAAAVTVSDGGVLLVKGGGTVQDVNVETGGSLRLERGAQFDGVTLAYGTGLVVTGGTGSGAFSLTGDIYTAGTLGAGCTISANGHKIHFEQYKQTGELTTNSDTNYAIDAIAFLTDNMDKLIGSVLDVVIDTNVYGQFRIADRTGYFDGTIMVTDYETGSSAEVGFDKYVPVGNALCELLCPSEGGALSLVVRSAVIDAPAVAAEYADNDQYDHVAVVVGYGYNPAFNRKYTYRYSTNADMSDAVVVEDDHYYPYAAGITLSKEDLVANGTYYVQVKAEDEIGAISDWSAPVSFTVVPKVLPDAPTNLSVTDATNASIANITFTVDGYDKNNSSIRNFRFRYADNPEMTNAITVTSGNRYINYVSIDKSGIVDGTDYYVQAGILYGDEWSYWSEAVVFNTQAWDYENITVDANGPYANLYLDGKRAKNVTVACDGFFYGGGVIDGLTVESGSFFRDDYATVTNAVLNGGNYWVNSGSTSNITINSGSLNLMNGVLEGAVICVNGSIYLGGTAMPTVRGTILIQGQFEIYYEHSVISTDAEFVFDVGAHEANKTRSFIDNIYVLGGNSKFTAKLDATPEAGDYLIASSYDVSNGLQVSLVANDETKLGTLQVGGDAIAYNGLNYSLVDQSGAAYLRIADGQNPSFTGKVKLSKSNVVFDSGNAYSNLTVSALSDCDYVLVEDGGQLSSVTVGNGGSVDLYGTVLGATVEAGGVLTMKTGSVADMTDITIRKGGSVVIEGGYVTTSMQFSIAGTLTVDGFLKGYASQQQGNQQQGNQQQGNQQDQQQWNQQQQWDQQQNQQNQQQNQQDQQSNKHLFSFRLDQLDAPSKNALISNYANLQCNPQFTATISSDQAEGEYKLAGNAASFTGSVSISSEGDNGWSEYLALGTECEINGTRYALSLKNDVLTLTVGDDTPDIVSDVIAKTQMWDQPSDTNSYVVEYSTDDFEHVARLTVCGNALDSFAAPAGCQWRVRAEEDDEWTVVDEIAAVPEDDKPKFIKSNADGVDDVFFARASKVWGSNYQARHVGSLSGEQPWQGTDEHVNLSGKNRLGDIFEGSADANVLLLTDDANGDALFVDDIYTALPGSIDEQQARIAQINEIRAGAGNDIIDMTSQRFAYIGDGMTIRGGNGDDTIWANNGSNYLFGDAGNDRLVGSFGTDFLVGGSGNDSMHGGGGRDVFTFGGNWGNDVIEQLDDEYSQVMLWFAEGDHANWNASTMTYTDGSNSVTVTGVSADQVEIYIGDEFPWDFEMMSELGIFAEATSQKIFEDKNKGLQASL